MINSVDLMSLSAIYADVPAHDIYYDSDAFNAVYPVTAFFDVSVPGMSPKHPSFWSRSGLPTDVGSDDYDVYYGTTSGVSVYERQGFVLAVDLGLDVDDDLLFPVYRLYARSIFTDSGEVALPDYYEYWLYAFDLGGAADFSYGEDYSSVPGYRLPLEYLAGRSDFEFPDFGGRNPILSVDDGVLTFLADIGRIIVLNNPFVGLFDFGIGNYNFFYLFLSAGFFVFCGWCLVKWFVPF